MVMTDLVEISEAYDVHVSDMANLLRKLVPLIEDLVRVDSLGIHSVSGRVKTRESFIKKCQKKLKYDSAKDVTDFIGVRIITYFESDIDRVADIISSEFDINLDHSIDKRKALDPDKFGYLSLHYVVKLNSLRANLSEYLKYGEAKFEIQIRSILQHAWAEIEHDLGYKYKEEVPRDVRRSFSQVASLLEVADKQFGEIRSTLKHYEQSIPSNAESWNSSVDINRLTLSRLIANGIIAAVDEQISRDTGIPLIDMGIPNLTRDVTSAGFKSAVDLLSFIRNNQSRIVRFAASVFENSNAYESSLGISKGTAVMYGSFLKCLDDGVSLNEIIGADEPSDEGFSDELQKAYNQVSN